MINDRIDIGIWIGIVISLLLHALIVAAYYYMGSIESETKTKVQAVTAAVLVRKGTPRPKHLLPRIYKTKPAAAPRQRVVENKAPTNTKSKTKRRPRVSDDDLMNRAMAIAERQRQRGAVGEDDPRAEIVDDLPGQPDGVVGGTATEGRAGSIYGAQLTQRIEDKMEFPEILSPQQIKHCRQKIRVVMFIDRQGKLLSQRLNIVQTSGDRRCDNAMLAAIKRASPFPAPPNHIWPVVKNGIIIQLSND
jgi:outer membrane biosynthesis protein TonB